MPLFGAIDNFRSEGDCFVLGGWAYASDGHQRLAVDAVEVPSRSDAKVEMLSNPDVGAGERFELYVKVPDRAFGVAVLLGYEQIWVCSGGERLRLFVWDKISSRLVLDYLLNVVGGLDEKQAAKLVGVLMPFFGRVHDSCSIKPSEVVPMLVEKGMTSFDGSAVVGGDGYIFLQGGSNRVSDQYTCAADVGVVDKWVELFLSRKERCRSRGAEFCQLIIPEKQSILGELHPDKISLPTPTYSALRDFLVGDECFFDAFGVLDVIYRKNGVSPFKRLDTHFSFLGARYFFEYFVENLMGKRPNIAIPFLETQLVSGDLAGRFGVGRFVSQECLPGRAGWAFGDSNPKVVLQHDPISGHVGSRRVWESASPLFDKSVLVFGNSFFERGSSSNGLSYWFSRAFRRVVFVWSSEMIDELVDQESPDFVICQTVERFFLRVPKL